MARLELTFLGTMQIRLDGKPLHLPYRKVAALLSYLVLEASKPHTREQLISLFWPELPTSVARNNLRQSLFQLRRRLNAPADAAPYLLVTGTTIQWNRDADYWLDVDEFMLLLQRGQTEWAIRLYQGELLATQADEGEEHNEWLDLWRHRLHRQAIAALQSLIAASETCHDYEALERHLHHLLALEPWQEKAHLRLMYLLLQRDDRLGALAHYAHYRDYLAQEFALEPGQEMTKLAEQILRYDSQQATSWGDLLPIQRSLLAQSVIFGPKVRPVHVDSHEARCPTLIERKLRHLFSLFDWNRDGYLEAEHFERSAQQMAQVFSYSPDSEQFAAIQRERLHWWHGLRAMADQDQDGRIGLDEWLAYWHAWMMAVAEEAGSDDRQAVVQPQLSGERIFAAVDRDKDGYLSAQEFALWLASWGVMADIESIFSLLDHDGDGLLSRDNVITYLRQFFLSNDPESPGNLIYGPLNGIRKSNGAAKSGPPS